MKFSLFFILMIAITIKAQKVENKLIDKTFQANIGSICEETPDYNPCAGAEIFLVLQFTKNKVTITQKDVSSCNKETIYCKYTYNWKFKETEIIINSKLEEIKYTYINKLKVFYKEEKLIGLITYGNGKTNSKEFKNILEKE